MPGKGGGLGAPRQQYYFIVSNGFQSATKFGNLCSDWVFACVPPIYSPCESQKDDFKVEMGPGYAPLKPSEALNFMGAKLQTPSWPTVLDLAPLTSPLHTALHSSNIPSTHPRAPMPLCLQGRQACSPCTSPESILLTSAVHPHLQYFAQHQVLFLSSTYNH